MINKLTRMVRNIISGTIKKALVSGAIALAAVVGVSLWNGADDGDKGQKFEGLPQTSGMVTPLPPAPAPGSQDEGPQRESPFPEVKRPTPAETQEHREQVRDDRMAARSLLRVQSDIRRLTPMVRDMVRYAPDARYPDGLDPTEVFNRTTDLMVNHRQDGTLEQFCHAYADLRTVHQAATAEYVASMPQGRGQVVGPDPATHMRILNTPAPSRRDCAPYLH
jgi:hypothetical protein